MKRVIVKKNYIYVFPVLLFLLTCIHFLLIFYFSTNRIFLEGIYAYIFLGIYSFILSFIILSISYFSHEKKYLIILAVFLFFNSLDLLTTFYDPIKNEFSMNHVLKTESVGTSLYLLHQKLPHAMVLASIILQKMVIILSAYSLLIVSKNYINKEKSEINIKKILSLKFINTLFTIILTYSFLVKEIGVLVAVINNCSLILYWLNNSFYINLDKILMIFLLVENILHRLTFWLLLVIPLVKILYIIIIKKEKNY